MEDLDGFFRVARAELLRQLKKKAQRKRLIRANLAGAGRLTLCCLPIGMRTTA
jgi:hypothetical protein